MLNLAVVWHHWIAVILSGGAVSVVILTIIGYIVKVERPRYPKK